MDELTAKIMRIAHRMPREAQPGARLFAQAGCLTCHSYSGVGSSNLGAPDLTREGIRGKGVAFQIRHLKCPTCAAPGSAMPSFATLGNKYLRQLAIFLEASRGS